MDIKERIAFADELLTRVLDFVPRVDARSQIFLGLDLGLILTMVLNLPTPDRLSWPMLSGIVAVALVLGSLWNLYREAFPQLGGGENSLLYFKEIAAIREVEFVRRFAVMDADSVLMDLTAQVWRNSQIVSQKYECLRRATIFFAWAIPFWLLTLGIFVVENRKLTLS